MLRSSFALVALPSNLNCLLVGKCPTNISLVVNMLNSAFRSSASLARILWTLQVWPLFLPACALLPSQAVNAACGPEA